MYDKPHFRCRWVQRLRFIGVRIPHTRPTPDRPSLNGHFIATARKYLLSDPIVTLHVRSITTSLHVAVTVPHTTLNQTL